MKILSLRLKSIFITAFVMLAVTIGVFLLAGILTDAVSGEAKMVPIYNADTDTDKVAIT